MNINISKLSCNAKLSETSNKKFFAQLIKKHPKNLDKRIQKIHDDVFQSIDCLDCANCCKSISPILRDKDIARISRHLKIHPSEFTVKYLKIDDDKDFVFRTQPCPFLMPNNTCQIYQSRPKACSEYPHTSQPGFINRLDLTLKNLYYCPAVYTIIERLKEKMKIRN